MRPVLKQELFGDRRIRDAATGTIAVVRSGRGNSFYGSTRPVASMGAWEDTFSNLTKGISDIANSVSNVIGAVKGKSPTYIVGGGQQAYNPYPYQPYMPYTPTNPNVPIYNYPQTPVQSAPKTNNTALYTALGVAAFGLIILLKK